MTDINQRDMYTAVHDGKFRCLQHRRVHDSFRIYFLFSDWLFFVTCCKERYCVLFSLTINFDTSSIFLIIFPLFLEPIVEIKASIDISIASWYKGTPIPMICIAKQSDYEKEQLHVS